VHAKNKPDAEAKELEFQQGADSERDLAVHAPWSFEHIATHQSQYRSRGKQ
jgi:hypothetical protein